MFSVASLTLPDSLSPSLLMLDSQLRVRAKFFSSRCAKYCPANTGVCSVRRNSDGPRSRLAYCSGIILRCRPPSTPGALPPSSPLLYRTGGLRNDAQSNSASSIWYRLLKSAIRLAKSFSSVVNRSSPDVGFESSSPEHDDELEQCRGEGGWPSGGGGGSQMVGAGGGGAAAVSTDERRLCTLAVSW